MHLLLKGERSAESVDWSGVAGGGWVEDGHVQRHCLGATAAVPRSDKIDCLQKQLPHIYPHHPKNYKDLYFKLKGSAYLHLVQHR